MDLFNHGFYWEAHEAWEDVWNGLGRRGPAADTVVALIRLAAAAIKLREPRPAAVRSHASAAVQRLEAVEAAIAPGVRCMGLSVPGIRGIACAVMEGREGRCTRPADRVEVVYRFVLWPGDPHRPPGDAGRTR